MVRPTLLRAITAGMGPLQGEFTAVGRDWAQPGRQQCEWGLTAPQGVEEGSADGEMTKKKHKGEGRPGKLASTDSC